MRFWFPPGSTSNLFASCCCFGPFCRGIRRSGWTSGYSNARYGAAYVLPVPFGAEEIADKDVRDQMWWVHVKVALLSVLAAGGGIYFAYALHLKNRERAEALAAQNPGLVRALEAKYWIDE